MLCLALPQIEIVVSLPLARGELQLGAGEDGDAHACLITALPGHWGRWEPVLEEVRRPGWLLDEGARYRLTTSIALERRGDRLGVWLCGRGIGTTSCTALAIALRQA